MLITSKNLNGKQKKFIHERYRPLGSTANPTGKVENVKTNHDVIGFDAGHRNHRRVAVHHRTIQQPREMLCTSAQYERKLIACILEAVAFEASRYGTLPLLLTGRPHQYSPLLLFPCPTAGSMNGETQYPKIRFMFLGTDDNRRK